MPLEYYLTQNIIEELITAPSVKKNLEIMLTQALDDKILSKEEKMFISIQFLNTLFFYHLPNILKNIEKLPGWPITSGIHSSTSNLSHFIDLFLQEYVRTLPSFLKDSDSLIKDLLNIIWQDKYAFLPMGVYTLYTNIDHEWGIKCKELYPLKDPTIAEKQRKFLLEGLCFILENTMNTMRATIISRRVLRCGC